MSDKFFDKDTRRTAIAVVLILVVVFGVGRMTMASHLMPREADVVHYAYAFNNGIHLDLRCELDKDEEEEFLALWHKMDWKLDGMHQDNVMYERGLDIKYSFTIMYLDEWTENMNRLWIYFCDDNAILVDRGTGDNELYIEKSGQYKKFLKFLGELNYIQYDEEGNAVLSDIDEKRKELEAEAQRIQEELERLEAAEQKK